MNTKFPKNDADSFTGLLPLAPLELCLGLTELRLWHSD